MRVVLRRHTASLVKEKKKISLDKTWSFPRNRTALWSWLQLQWGFEGGEENLDFPNQTNNTCNIVFVHVFVESKSNNHNYGLKLAFHTSSLYSVSLKSVISIHNVFYYYVSPGGGRINLLQKNKKFIELTIDFCSDTHGCRWVKPSDFSLAPLLKPKEIKKVKDFSFSYKSSHHVG